MQAGDHQGHVLSCMENQLVGERERPEKTETTGLVVTEAVWSADSLFLSSLVQVGFVFLATKRVLTQAWVSYPD